MYQTDVYKSCSCVLQYIQTNAPTKFHKMCVPVDIEWDKVRNQQNMYSTNIYGTL